jgi:uncharacterized membrane protein YuzA (DUF378 family)
VSSVWYRTWQIWRWPATIAGLVSFGLLAALLGQGGIWWKLSWIALMIPLIVVVAAVMRRHQSNK